MIIVPRGTLNPKSAKRAVGKSERLTSSEMVGCSVSDDTCSTWNNPSEITLKCCGKTWTVHVELRWLAAVCQMTMFHEEQSIRNHLKALWENVNGSCRVEVVGCSVSDDNCSTLNNPSEITLKCCGKPWTVHVELRWLAAVCQMTMFHVEQSIRNHFKLLREKTWTVHVELRWLAAVCQMTIVPRGTINKKIYKPIHLWGWI